MANLQVNQKSVKDLFQSAARGFLIPDYQRPYEWDEPECRTLWDDIITFCFPDNDKSKFDEKNEYFLGPIVTFKNENSCMEVIDGQQRITTLILLLRALYKRLIYMNDSNTQGKRAELEKCIWLQDKNYNIDFSTPRVDSQVATDSDRDDFIKILKSGETNEASEKSNHYVQNFKFFEKQLIDFLLQKPSYFDDLVNRLLDHCVLLPIEADSQDTALRIFTTLNDRGKPLADADIFKAQFYKYYSNKGKKEEFMETWRMLDEITTSIFSPNQGTPMDELFTRYMYYERAKMGIKNTTTEGLRKFFEGDGTYPLLREEKTMQNLVSLAMFWQNVTKQDSAVFSERLLKKLFILNYAPNSMWANITSVYFMCNRKEDNSLDEVPFSDFLDRITAFIFAYSVTNPGVNSLRTPIFSEMVKIVNGEEVTFTGLNKNINGEEVEFSDFKFIEDSFRAVISNYAFINNRAITRSMLTWWAFQNDKQDLLNLETHFDIEHIFSKSIQNKGRALQDKASVELLGNKVLLEKRINISASDYRFSDKKKYYLGFKPASGPEKEGSKIAELKNLCGTHDDFGENDIKKRNQQIIDAFVEFLRTNNLLLK